MISANVKVGSHLKVARLPIILDIVNIGAHLMATAEMETTTPTMMGLRELIVGDANSVCHSIPSTALLSMLH